MNLVPEDVNPIEEAENAMKLSLQVVDSAGNTADTTPGVESKATASLEPCFDFSINKLVSSNSLSNTDEIVSRLESFAKKYEQMASDIQAASQLVDKSSQFAKVQIESAVFTQYRRKLHAVQQSMTSIDNRLIGIQERLNGVRQQLPAKKHSLVETGPFYYKCVYPGGVRYRDYPSSSAKVVSADAVVTLNQVVEIAERVFIASEHSVYLHSHGVGWLFENKKDIICFLRVAAPPLST